MSPHAAAVVLLLASLGADDGVPVPGFRVPRHEIGLHRLLDQHPTFDGRGVVVAIFDTGVDPGAPGLQQTTDGRPKVIDMIDGSGAGDVDMRIVRKRDGDAINSVTGNPLRIPADWRPESGEFRVGVKRGFDFLPGALVSRLKAERKRDFDRRQRDTADRLRRELAAWDAQHTAPTDPQRRTRTELQARLDALAAAAKSYEDPGPTYDCVVFKQRDRWRAAVDTDTDGDLTDERVLTDFFEAREFATFAGTSLNFGVNVFDDGQTLSLVGNCGAHGTHVAGIVGAHYPAAPYQNGIAPGVQFVSVMIGDARLGSMETGRALERGLARAVARGCDLINMSYGEPTRIPNAGRLIELFSEVVNEHHVMFVASAGNSGPALSTVGAPGGTTSAVLGVGAYISPAMMLTAYAAERAIPATGYAWTSRGPTFDGDLGVDIFAPGGAVAPVPRWTLSPHMRMNGTSMASPNACGAAAVLISGMKQRARRWSPYSIRKAMKNTARPVGGVDRFAQGPGLVQVDHAMRHLLANGDRPGERLRFRIGVNGDARGIYLRERSEVDGLVERRVSVRPEWARAVDASAKTGFELPLELKTTADWIRTGKHLLLTANGDSFTTTVDTTKLSAGAHYGEVHGLDRDRPERGPVFRVPVTVIVPHSSIDTALSVSAGRMERRFYEVPQQATWLNIRMTRMGGEGTRSLVLHTVQRQNDRSPEDAELRRYVTLRAGQTESIRVPVVAGRTVEVCLGQRWWSRGDTQVNWQVRFGGVMPSERRVTIGAGERSRRVVLTASTGPVRISPRVALQTLRRTLSPDSMEIRPLDAKRDRLPDGSQTYELVMTWNIDQSQAGSITPRFPAGDGRLYESGFGGHLWSLYDAANRHIRTDDAWPEPLRIGKGKHVLKLAVRHSDVARLESLRDFPVVVDRPLTQKLACDLFATESAAESGRTKLSSSWLSGGESVAVHIARPPTVPAANAGDVLVGTITYAAEADAQRPGGFPIHVAAAPRRSSSASKPGESKSGESARARRARELRVFQIDQLKQVSIANRKSFDRLANERLVGDEHDLRVLKIRLEKLDDVRVRKQWLSDVVAAADAILERIDRKQLAIYFGRTARLDDDEAKQRDARMRQRRDLLANVLYRKGRALGYMELPDVIAKRPIRDPAAHDRAFEETFAELQRWVDTTDRQYVLLRVRWHRRKSRYGQALKLLNDQIKTAEPTFWYHKKRRDIYEQLGWQHLFENESQWMAVRFPLQAEARLASPEKPPASASRDGRKLKTGGASVVDRSAVRRRGGG